jgi:hypothetical protein
MLVCSDPRKSGEDAGLMGTEVLGAGAAVVVNGAVAGATVGVGVIGVVGGIVVGNGDFLNSANVLTFK